MSEIGWEAYRERVAARAAERDRLTPKYSDGLEKAIQILLEHAARCDDLLLKEESHRTKEFAMLQGEIYACRAVADKIRELLPK